MPQMLCKCIVIAVTVAVSTIIKNRDNLGSAHEKN